MALIQQLIFVIPSCIVCNLTYNASKIIDLRSHQAILKLQNFVRHNFATLTEEVANISTTYSSIFLVDIFKKYIPPGGIQ